MTFSCSESECQARSWSKLAGFELGSLVITLLPALLTEAYCRKRDGCTCLFLSWMRDWSENRKKVRATCFTQALGKWQSIHQRRTPQISTLGALEYQPGSARHYEIVHGHKLHEARPWPKQPVEILRCYAWFKRKKKGRGRDRYRHISRTEETTPSSYPHTKTLSPASLLF